jgi:teichuronic acid biosynthesis glycosyltransferase TuaG
MNNCLISIIVTYYKKKNFISETINSILNQTYNNFEILLIYDDSEKNDLDFIKNFLRIDKRIKLTVNDKNLGAGQSRNVGIKLAKGEYIAFIDADDLWKKNKLERQLLYMQKYCISFCHTSYDVMNENGKYLFTRDAKNFDSFKQIITSCDIGLSSVMIKKHLLENGFIFSNLRTKEDFYLWLTLLKKGITLYGLDESLTQWRNLKNSLSSSYVTKLYDGFKLYNLYLGYGKLKSLYLLFILSLNFLIKRLKKK